MSGSLCSRAISSNVSPAVKAVYCGRGCHCVTIQVKAFVWSTKMNTDPWHLDGSCALRLPTELAQTSLWHRRGVVAHPAGRPPPRGRPPSAGSRAGAAPRRRPPPSAGGGGEAPRRPKRRNRVRATLLPEQVNIVGMSKRECPG